MFSCAVLPCSRLSISQRPPAFTAAKSNNSRVVLTKVVVAEAAAASAKKTKASELRMIFSSTEGIDQEVDRLRSEMFSMRIKFAKREEYKPAQYKALRRRIAQLLTIKRERAVEEGVSRREFRAAEQRRLVEAGLGQF